MADLTQMRRCRLDNDACMTRGWRDVNACLWCYCRMDLIGTLPEDIAVLFGLIPCALPYARDHEQMEFEKVYSGV